MAKILCGGSAGGKLEPFTVEGSGGASGSTIGTNFTAGNYYFGSTHCIYDYTPSVFTNCDIVWVGTKRTVSSDIQYDFIIKANGSTITKGSTQNITATFWPYMASGVELVSP